MRRILSNIVSQREGDARWSIAKTYLLNIVFCTVVAVCIWIAVPRENNPGFFSNFVHAQSIGNIICSLILLANCLLDYFKKIPKQVLLFVMPVIIIVGFYAGSSLARVLLGLPTKSFTYNNDRHLLIVSMVITVVVTIIINWFFTSQNTIAKLRVKTAEESERATQAQLSMLLAQIEPHMLFNTLANLRALIDSEPKRAKEMLDLLIDYLRTTLRHSRAESVLLESEFKMLENYLSLMRIRLGDRLIYTTELPDELKNCSIPSLLLQPIVENAIKHGIEPAVSGGAILIKAESANNELILTVQDTGQGIINKEAVLPSSLDTAQQATHTDGGFGMANVRARCVAMSGGSYEVVSPLPESDRGTSVRIQIPLRVETPACSMNGA